MTRAKSRIAEILRALAEKPHTITQLCDRFDVDPDNIKTAIYTLAQDGRIRVVGVGDNGRGVNGRKPFLYGLPAEVAA